MSVEQFNNDGETTLSGTINNSVTSLSVASAANFPTRGNFRIMVDSEYMLVTAVSGTTFTVTRGIEGSTAIGHAAGSVVIHPITAASLKQAVRDIGNILSLNDYNPVADGTTDDSTVIQTALNALSAGQTLVIRPGTYGVGTGLTVGTANVTIRCIGRVIFKKVGSSNIDCLSLNAASCTLLGLEIDGNSVGSTGSGIGIFANFNRVECCEVHHNVGHGIYLDSTPLGSAAFNNIVHNYCHDNTGIGISQHGATDNLIHGNICNTNGLEGITIDVASWRCRVTCNHVKANCQSGGAGNISGDQCDLSVIANNEVHDAPSGKLGIIMNNQVGDSSYVNITNNVICDNLGGGIYLKHDGGNSTHCVIMGNVIRSSNSSVPIKLDASNNSNLVIGNSLNGLSITNSGTSNTLANNA